MSSKGVFFSDLFVGILKKIIFSGENMKKLGFLDDQKKIFFWNRFFYTFWSEKFSEKFLKKLAFYLNLLPECCRFLWALRKVVFVKVLWHHDFLRSKNSFFLQKRARDGKIWMQFRDQWCFFLINKFFSWFSKLKRVHSNE